MIHAAAAANNIRIFYLLVFSVFFKFVFDFLAGCHHRCPARMWPGRSGTNAFYGAACWGVGRYHASDTDVKQKEEEEEEEEEEELISRRAQELCESGGGRPGLPVPNSPNGLCGRKAILSLNFIRSLAYLWRLTWSKAHHCNYFHIIVNNYVLLTHTVNAILA